MSWFTSKSRLRGLLSGAAAVAFAWPAGAWACSVCFSARAANLRAYWGTALFLMILPLTMLSGFLIWLCYQQKGLDHEPPGFQRGAVPDEATRPWNAPEGS